jgi:hypothetical protein
MKYITFILCICLPLVAYCNPVGIEDNLGNVKDSNNGYKGYILIHSGNVIGNYNDVGIWTDPNDLGFISNSSLETEINNRIKADTELSGDINEVKKQNVKQDEEINNIKLVNSRQDQKIKELSETKYNLELVVRLLETRKTILEIYNTYDLRHNNNVAIGLRFTYKLGKSYQDKVLEELDKKLKKLENIIDKIK